MKVDFNIDLSKYKQLGQALPEARKRFLTYAKHHMIERLQVFSPVDTGFLKGWFVWKEDDSMVDIRSPAYYAIYQDQGTYSYGPSHRKPKTKDVGGIRPKRFVEKSINATSYRLKEFYIRSLEESL